MYYRYPSIILWLFFPIILKAHGHNGLRRTIIPNETRLNLVPEGPIVVNNTVTARPFDPWIEKTYLGAIFKAEHYHEPYAHYDEVQTMLADVLVHVAEQVR